MVRAWVAFAWTLRVVPSLGSTSSTVMPRRPSSFASIRPKGPPPAISTETSVGSTARFWALPRGRPSDRNADPGALSARARRSVIPPDGQASVSPGCDSEIAPPAPLWLLRGERRGVAQVLAVHRVDHVLEDVGGVVADALEGLGDEEIVEAARDRVLAGARSARPCAQAAAWRDAAARRTRSTCGLPASVKVSRAR